MSEPFRPYEKLVEITVFGKKFQVPERNSLLRCFQFISPETIPYGRFCWNQDCQYCRVTCQLPDEDEPHEMLSSSQWSVREEIITPRFAVAAAFHYILTWI